MLQDAILGWAATARRDLPWRRTRDPWAVLVSEVMLQQTQVARVVPHYREFLDRFPTAGACAAAPLADVVREWDGLGYNRRAVNLHRAAAAVVRDHGGAVPDDLDSLLALPGVGAYTARAVMVFAFEADVGLVETNTARVLARALARRPLSRLESQRLADELVPHAGGWAWNQALFDLGATVCTKRAPACGDCPILDGCAWSRAGRADPDPAEGSAGAGRRQSPFEDSDRRGRGRLVAALRRARVPVGELAEVTGWPGHPDRAQRVALGLVDDGLVRQAGDLLELA